MTTLYNPSILTLYPGGRNKDELPKAHLKDEAEDLTPAPLIYENDKRGIPPNLRRK